MNLLLVLTRLIWKRLTQNWGGAFEREATKNILYNKTLEKESDNFFYADFSNIDFTQNKNVKLFIKYDNSALNYSNYLNILYGEKSVLPSGAIYGSSLNNGIIKNFSYTNLNIGIRQEIGMSVNISGSVNNAGKELNLNYANARSFIFLTAYLSPEKNFWGIRCSTSSIYTGTVKVIVTGDKII